MAMESLLEKKYWCRSVGYSPPNREGYRTLYSKYKTTIELGASSDLKICNTRRQNAATLDVTPLHQSGFRFLIPDTVYELCFARFVAKYYCNGIEFYPTTYRGFLLVSCSYASLRKYVGRQDKPMSYTSITGG